MLINTLMASMLFDLTKMTLVLVFWLGLISLLLYGFYRQNAESTNTTLKMVFCLALFISIFVHASIHFDVLTSPAVWSVSGVLMSILILLNAKKIYNNQ